MRIDILTLALIVGACTWGFRYFPIRANLLRLAGHGMFGRFLGATGPAAIATLFTAAVWPMAQSGPISPLIGGTLTVLGLFFWRRSVVVATIGGAIAYGLLSAI